ncbi:hypothetical protein BN3661_02204 [Eubacteriaceae bacterium CHKCI005]|nr:hypothetical protein BN3661_02204 [Eubacteriaceae bacterium CHKCI005]
MGVKHGVDYYTIGRGEIKSPFPEDAVDCQHCKYLDKDRCGRLQCRITDRSIYRPVGYIDSYCPFTIFETIKED